MRRGHHRDHPHESGVATLIEYLMVSGVLMVLFVIMMLLVNANYHGRTGRYPELLCIHRYW